MARRSTFSCCFDEVAQITIGCLRELGYLEPLGRKSGTLSWSRHGQQTSSICLTVDMQEGYVELDYRCRDKPINYRVRLMSIVSNLGKGHIWYFVCPNTGRKCRKLYGIGDYFLSRFAYPAAMYRCQTEPKSDRGFRRFLTLHGTTRNPKAEWDYFNRKRFRTYYNGKPTKKYQKYLERMEKLGRVIESGIWRPKGF
jgi:hypothetical protein